MILGKWPTWHTNSFLCIYFFIYNSLHVLSTSFSSSGEKNWVNTTSRNCHSALVATLCAGWESTPSLHTTRPPTQVINTNPNKPVYSQPAHNTATNTEWQLLEVVLIQFVSPDDEHDVLETCRVKNKNKYIERNLCVTLVIYQESLQDARSTKCIMRTMYVLWASIFLSFALPISCCTWLLGTVKQVYTWPTTTQNCLMQYC